MGKSKTKKSKQATESSSVATDGNCTTESPGRVNAIDGHNTQGWTDGEIKAYNDLIVERQKLERQRNQLEEKCAKSHTQRALLHENIASIDGMFKPQKPTSDLLKYTGPSACCVDLDLNLTKCHHDLCRRAKNEGISDTELDTIKYYAMRMYTEKSDRVRSALRKQRDIELDRVRKEDQEEQSQNARRSAKKPKATHGDIQKTSARGTRGREVTKAAKETEKIVNKIINQLDDLRTDLQAGRISAEEAQGKLDLLDRNLPLGHGRPDKLRALNNEQFGLSNQDIDLTKKTLQTDLRDRLLGAKGDTFSQAFSIMDHFLSATKPGDLQDAISELKDVLQLAGPMCDDLQKSLGALEGIFDNPERLAFTGPDGKQECSSSIIELMEKLKENLKRTGQLPDGANASLTKVFQDCIDLEEDAKNCMVKQASSLSLSTNELQDILVEIKDDCVAKSPIPPLTSNKLDSDISALLDIHDVHRLLAKTRSGAESQELEAQIASQVISRTARRPEMYVETLKRLEIACHQIGGDDYPQLLERAFSVVLEKMSKFKPQPQTKKGNQLTNKAKAQDETSTKAPQDKSENEDHSPSGAATSTSKPEVSTTREAGAVDEQVHDIKKMVQERVRDGDMGELWDVFELYHCDTSFEADLAMFDKVLNYKDQVRTIIESGAGGIEAAVLHLFSHRLCPAFGAALVAQALWDLVDRPDRDVRPYIKQLASCIDVSFPSISEEWIAIFRHLVLAMMQLYVASFVEATVAVPEISAVHFAVFTVTIFATFVHLTRTPSQAYENLAVMTNFLYTCFDQDPADLNSILDSALVHYGYFCHNDQFKCMTTLSCSKHMTSLQDGATNAFSRRNGGPMTKFEEMMWSSQAHKDHRDFIEHSPLPDSSDHVATGRQHNSIRFRSSLEVTAHYRSNEHPQRQRERHKRTRDARLAECLRKAAILHESTAKKALALLQLRADEYEAEKLPPPTELLLAMDELLNVTDDAHHHPISSENDTDRDKRSVHSRFAEHLEEPISYQKRSTKALLAIQNVFKMLRTGSLGPTYLNEFIDKMKLLAMSGRFSNPIQFIDQHRANLAQVGKLPEPFAQALVRTQNEIYAELELPEVMYACETKRLQCLLATVGGNMPSPSTLFRLVIYRPKDLDEYCSIISGRFKEIDELIVSKLEDLWLQLRELGEAGILGQNSPSLIEFAGFAMQDWCRRPIDITKYAFDNEDRQSSRPETGNTRIALTTENDRLPTISENSAEQPEKTSPPLSEQKSSNGLRLDNASTRTDSILTSTTNNQPLPDTHTPPANPTKSPTSTQQTDEHRPTRAAYLSLPSNPTHNPAHPRPNVDETPKPSSTPPPSFRQLDMAKRLASLQSNSRDLSATVKTVTDTTHARVLEGLAGKLQEFVAGLADAVDKLADLKGVRITGLETPSTDE